MERSRRTPWGEYFGMSSPRANACSFHDSVFVFGTLAHPTSRAGAALVASASLLTEAVKGKTLAEVHSLFDEVHTVLTHHDAPVDTARLGKLAALAGVRDFPARVKCASLCWHTLNAALERQPQAVSTE